MNRKEFEATYEIELPLMQDDLYDIFGDPHSEDFQSGYLRNIDLNEFAKELDHVKAFHHTKSPFGFYGNYIMAEVLKDVFRDIIAQGLQHEIVTFDGCHCVRPMKGNSDRDSVHSWALALDFNALTNKFGSKKTTFSNKFILCFTKHGFEWGGVWSVGYQDPMHFQFAWIRRNRTGLFAPQLLT